MEGLGGCTGRQGDRRDTHSRQCVFICLLQIRAHTQVSVQAARGNQPTHTCTRDYGERWHLVMGQGPCGESLNEFPKFQVWFER